MPLLWPVGSSFICHLGLQMLLSLTVSPLLSVPTSQAIMAACPLKALGKGMTKSKSLNFSVPLSKETSLARNMSKTYSSL